MAIKKYHVSANLFDGSLQGGVWEATLTLNTSVNTAVYKSFSINLPIGTYTLSFNHSVNIVRNIVNNVYSETTISNVSEFTFTVNSNYTVYISFRDSTSSTTVWDNSPIMLNSGSTPLPYEPYGNTWNTIPYRKYGTETDTITTLPKTIIGDGTAISSYTIKGAMSQSGTPSPSNPIYPQECGDKTANLFYENYTGISSSLMYKPLYVGSGDFTLSSTIPNGENNIRNLFLLAGNVSSGASLTTNGVALGFAKTVSSVDGYVTIAYRSTTSGNPNSPADYDTMLNSGSTTLPYEPYGYKIPISSASTTTPVYLGEVQSTRQIKKLVFDGTEDWKFTTYPYCTFINDYLRTRRVTCMCSHLLGVTNINIGDSIEPNTCCFLVDNYAFYYKDTSFSSVADFKSYLAAQYAAGTPVTVWYVLSTPTTTTLNEPIRKIGDYSDSVSATNLPTTGTAEQFDVDTTLKPSEVSLTYHGWHEHSDTVFSSS